MTDLHNYNCDGSKCRSPEGEVRVYPLGGGANLILCRACWRNENDFRRQRNMDLGRDFQFQINSWDDAAVYLGRLGKENCCGNQS